MKPTDPQFSAKVRDSFERQDYMKLLGARLVKLEAGVCWIEAPFKKELTQQHGYFHAGVSASIADSACGYAAFSLMPAGSSVLSIEFKLNLLAPAQGEKLIARGEVIRAGKTIKVCRCDVFGVIGGEETLCATMLATMTTMHGKPDQGSGA